MLNKNNIKGGLSMSKRIITISREFGSGGRTIGRELAKQLGWKFYDKELVNAVALETGFAEDYIEEHGEHAPSASMFAYAFTHPGAAGLMRGMSITDFLWVVQREVILKIAEESPCVIVGRNADYILKDREDVLNVFIHASKDYRAERIVRLYGESEKTPLQRLNEKDKKRAVNYRHYTSKEWGDSRNYHISLDSGVLGEETCVEIIKALAEKD